MSGVYFGTPEEEGFDHNTSLFEAAKAILDGKNETPLVRILTSYLSNVEDI